MVDSRDNESSSSGDEENLDGAATPTGQRSQYSFNTCREGNSYPTRGSGYRERQGSFRQAVDEHVYDSVSRPEFRHRTGAVSCHQPRPGHAPPLPPLPPPVHRLPTYTTWTGRVAPTSGDLNVNIRVSIRPPDYPQGHRSAHPSARSDGTNPLLDTTQSHRDTARILWRRLRSDVSKMASTAAEVIRRRPL